MIDKKYADYSWEKASALLNIDSPTGFTKKAAEFVKKEFSALGFPAEYTVKGGVLADLGGKDDNNALLLEAHTDTLGGMVAEVKSNGRLRITPLGGMNACNAETENVRIYTRSGKIYEGALQLCNASIHVNGDFSTVSRTWDSVEIVIDEDVKTDEDTRKLGIETGDIVCFEPRTRRTESGYLKSRFLDDKLSVGILLGFAKYLKDNGIVLPRRVYVHVTVYEEVGHGGGRVRLVGCKAQAQKVVRSGGVGPIQTREPIDRRADALRMGFNDSQGDAAGIHAGGVLTAQPLHLFGWGEKDVGVFFDLVDGDAPLRGEFLGDALGEKGGFFPRKRDFPHGWSSPFLFVVGHALAHSVLERFCFSP